MKKIRFNKAPCVYNQGMASANSKFYGGSLLPTDNIFVYCLLVVLGQTKGQA